VALLIIAAPLLSYQQASALDVTNRSLSLGDSKASVNTTHQISFTYVSAASIGSLEFEYCSNSPLPGTACTAPNGFDVTSAVLSSETGVVGYSVHTNTTANRIVLTRVAGAVPPSTAAQYLFSGVINPDAAGSYYLRIGTFASTDGTGARTDEGGVAFSINDPLTVAAYVPPFLLFCTATSIPTNNCSSAVGDFIDFGEFNSQTTSYATTQMIAATNGGDGYTITVSGTTMTSGNNIIDAPITPSTSQIGVSQFGFNLVNNSNPNVGANTVGAGSGLPTNDYDNVNRFMYNETDIVAESSLPTDINKYTVSYIVNIDENQAPGVYSTTLTYTALASF
jgi:hypothetical protein